jgi:16S rRNA (cytosine1402-N4)-methyltransferase
MNRHVPVLLSEVLALAPEAGLFIDGTAGDGGHSQAMLEARPQASLLAVDRDPVSVQRATERLQPIDHSRWQIMTASYADAWSQLTAEQRAATRFVLLDLGFSSAQMDNAERGLSFQADGPLDMRYDQTDIRRPTAAEILYRTNVVDLANLIYKYGEERQSRKIARIIVEARQKQPLTTTRELAELIAKHVKTHPKDKIHPATLTFQALRIAVNDELGELERFLAETLPELPSKARVAIISFHSLEDRLVKRAFASLTKPRENEYGERVEPRATSLTKKPIVAGEAEVQANPRSRSAKLRAIELL